MSEENNRYSMMGLLKQDQLAALYHEGGWHQFANLQQAMSKMEKRENGDGDKHSIPDVYGRPFQLWVSLEAMMNKTATKEYLLTREIKTWRGIITAIALQKFLHLQLACNIVNYTQTGNAFDEALKYPPHTSGTSYKASWNQLLFHILTLEGDNKNQPSDIALFSPMTLIYPVADLESKMPHVKNLKWFDYDEKKFVNPPDVLNLTEKMIVCYWIDALNDLLKKQNMQVIQYHLNAYKDELINGLNGVNYTTKSCFKLMKINQEIGFNLSSTDPVIDMVLNTTVKLEFLFDQFQWIDYDELFADQLYYTVKPENPFAGCAFSDKHKIGNKEAWYALLPLGKKLGQLLNRKSIDQLIHVFKMYKDSEIKKDLEYIQVNLNLSNISNQYIDAEKKYYINNGSLDTLEEKRSFPTIGLWPAKKEQNIGKSYIYIEGLKERSIELNCDKVIKGSNPHVNSVEGFPKAISLKSNIGKRQFDIGMILPEYKQSTNVNKAVVNAVVGIDFGTSGTTVYARIYGENKIVQVVIQRDLSLLLTRTGNKDPNHIDNLTSQKMIDQYFIANNPEDEKLSSIYRRTSENPLQTVEPILDGIIYQAKGNELIEYSGYFMPDIKWENPNNGAYYKAFIQELCIHIWNVLRNEHVTSITWKYALPLSMANCNLFHAMWQNDILGFLQNNILGCNHAIGIGKHSESEAASLYFLSSEELRQVNADKGYMVIDIGGGSTDIAVWQRREGEKEVSMVAQTSVPVAGRMLFTRWIAINSNEISEQVFVNENPIREELKKLNKLSEDTSIANAVIERMVNYNNEKIMTAYCQNSSWARRLKAQLEFGVALLFFSLGSLTGYLRQQKKLALLDDKGYFSIALCGNGSKILDWMKMKSSYPELHQMFREGVASRGMAHELKDTKIIKSKNPKKEVALGLVIPNVYNLNSCESVTEEISKDQALCWNKAFAAAYERVFQYHVEIDENEIIDILTKIDKKMDVCNFFLNVMYGRYYIKIVKRLR